MGFFYSNFVDAEMDDQSRWLIHTRHSRFLCPHWSDLDEDAWVIRLVLNCKFWHCWWRSWWPDMKQFVPFVSVRTAKSDMRSLNCWKILHSRPSVYFFNDMNDQWWIINHFRYNLSIVSNVIWSNIVHRWVIGIPLLVFNPVSSFLTIFPLAPVILFSVTDDLSR